MYLLAALACLLMCRSVRFQSRALMVCMIDFIGVCPLCQFSTMQSCVNRLLLARTGIAERATLYGLQYMEVSVSGLDVRS